MALWRFRYNVVKTVVPVDLNTVISNMDDHMEEILVNLGLRELIFVFVETNFQVTGCNNFQRIHHCHIFLSKSLSCKI